jgi:hypothetical protein
VVDGDLLLRLFSHQLFAHALKVDCANSTVEADALVLVTIIYFANLFSPHFQRVLVGRCEWWGLILFLLLHSISGCDPTLEAVVAIVRRASLQQTPLTAFRRWVVLSVSFRPPTTHCFRLLELQDELSLSDDGFNMRGDA